MEFCLAVYYLVFFPSLIRWMVVSSDVHYILRDQNEAKMCNKSKSARWTYAIINIATHVDFFVLNIKCVYTSSGVWTSQIQRSSKPKKLILGMRSITRKSALLKGVYVGGRGGIKGEGKRTI